jgi:CheY-like chemotaxis protein
MKILIADDDNVSRLLLATVLKKQGHEVVAAENGLKAWEAFQKDYFPMLILDWLMPGMDGLALCRQARKVLRENYTYIILLSLSPVFTSSLMSPAREYSTRMRAIQSRCCYIASGASLSR